MRTTVKFKKTVQQEKEIDLPFYYKKDEVIFKHFEDYCVIIQADCLRCIIELSSLEGVFQGDPWLKRALEAMDKQSELKEEFERRYTDFKKHVEGLS